MVLLAYSLSTEDRTAENMPQIENRYNGNDVQHPPAYLQKTESTQLNIIVFLNVVFQVLMPPSRVWSEAHLLTLEFPKVISIM